MIDLGECLRQYVAYRTMDDVWPSVYHGTTQSVRSKVYGSLKGPIRSIVSDEVWFNIAESIDFNK
jgi:hypothetical protein